MPNCATCLMPIIPRNAENHLKQLCFYTRVAIILTVLIFADLSYDGDHFLTSGMLFPLLVPLSGLWFLLFLRYCAFTFSSYSLRVNMSQVSSWTLLYLIPLSFLHSRDALFPLQETPASSTCHKSLPDISAPPFSIILSTRDTFFFSQIQFILNKKKFIYIYLLHI